MGEDEFWIYDEDDDDDDAFEDENWEYFDEAAAAAEEASRPQFLKENNCFVKYLVYSTNNQSFRSAIACIPANFLYRKRKSR